METSHKGYRIQYEQGHDGWMCRIFRPNGVLMLNCPIAPTRTDEGTYLKMIYARIDDEEDKIQRFGVPDNR
jgi:hypothetical protein